MKKSSRKLTLKKTTVRTLTPAEVRGIVGGMRGGGCCIGGTELMSPETQPGGTGGGCCIQATELMSPTTA
jgi:hypothetical protein